jgi:hypothetical protein
MKKEIHEKKYCPICGSTNIRCSEECVCLDCRARSFIPKKTKIRLAKKPEYVG